MKNGKHDRSKNGFHTSFFFASVVVRVSFPSFPRCCCLLLFPSAWIEIFYFRGAHRPMYKLGWITSTLASELLRSVFRSPSAYSRRQIPPFPRCVFLLEISCVTGTVTLRWARPLHFFSLPIRFRLPVSREPGSDVTRSSGGSHVVLYRLVEIKAMQDRWRPIEERES